VDDSSVVRVEGEIDVSTISPLRDELNGLVADGYTNISVDLRNVDFLDSTALGLLVGVHKRCSEAGGHLRLVIDSPRILKLFEITGLTDLIEIVDDL